MLIRLLNLAEREVLLVKGPASVRCEGRVFLLGMDVSRKEVGVRTGKVLPFEVSGYSRARLSLKSGGDYRVLGRRSRLGVRIWEDVAREVLVRKPKRIMLLGATDTGKSTLAAYLSNIVIAAGLKVGVVDGDVGQGDLAPPACIGASIIGKQLCDLRDIDAEYYAFIGTISPTGVQDLVIRSMKYIVHEYSSRSDICIINTDGYMDEHGIDYKVELTRTLKPDLLVYLGNGTKADRSLEEFRERLVYSDAPELVTKTHREREERRLDQYRRFVEGGDAITFGMRSKKFGLMGRLHKVISAKDSVIIGSARFPRWFLKGMFVGLGNRGSVRGFGVVFRVAYSRMTLRTPYQGEFDTILLSTIRLTQNMRQEYQMSLQAVR